MGSSVAPKAFPSPGKFGQSQTNVASQVQTPDQAVNPQGPSQSQGIGSQFTPAADPTPQPQTFDPNQFGRFDAQDEVQRLRRIQESRASGGPMPFY